MKSINDNSDPEELRRKIETLKKTLKELHQGRNIDEEKEKIKNILSKVKPWEIPFIEQELVKEGVSPFEIVNMYDIHVELFRESLIREFPVDRFPEGHPLRTFFIENTKAMEYGEKVSLYVTGLTNSRDDVQRGKYLESLRELVKELFSLRNHFAKVQMLLFPYLERLGLTAVPRVLWTKQDQVMHTVKMLYTALMKGDMQEIRKEGLKVSHALIDMVFRENKILFPTASVLLKEGDWAAIASEMDSVGYFKYRPVKKVWKPLVPPRYPYEITEAIPDRDIESLPKEVKTLLTKAETPDTYSPTQNDRLEFPTGFLSKEEINEIMRSVPIDISFIDKDDRLIYYSPGDRVFVRAKTALGRKVDHCHPPRSVGIVKRIIEEFRKGRRNKAVFWLRINGRLIYITYIPGRREDGEYLGTVEVVQDITDLKKIEGEKRMLDWN